MSWTVDTDITDTRQRRHGRSTQISRTPDKGVTDSRYRYHGQPTEMSRTHDTHIARTTDEDVTNARCIYHGHLTGDVMDARQTDTTDVILTPFHLHNSRRTAIYDSFDVKVKGHLTILRNRGS